MNADDDLSDAFHSLAARAPDAVAFHGTLYDAIDRRRRRRQAGSVVGVGLAVSGLALGIYAIQPSGDHHQGVAAGGSPTLTATTVAVTTSTSAPPIVRVTPTVTATRSFVDGGKVKGSDEAPRNKFFSAGYTIDDAIALAAAWGANGNDATYTAKVVGGQLLLDGHDLPMPPGQQPPHGIPSAIDAGAQAFLANGHGMSDAERLAALWNDGAPVATVKALAGTQLLDGHTLNFG